MTYDAGYPCCTEYGIMRKRIEELEKALKPFADAVYNDNGDMTISYITDREA